MLSTLFSFAPDQLVYVDGGTGSMVIQAVLAAGFAAAYGFRGALARVVSLVKRTPRQNPDQTA